MTDPQSGKRNWNPIWETNPLYWNNHDMPRACFSASVGMDSSTEKIAVKNVSHFNVFTKRDSFDFKW